MFTTDMRLDGCVLVRCGAVDVRDGVMTVADSSNFSQRPGRAGQRTGAESAGIGRNGGGRVAKVGADVADLLFVNTLETPSTKSPGEAPGASDLLDAMVEDHLERAVPAMEEEGAEHAAEVAGAGAPGVELSEDQRNDLLKREIDMLLAGTPVEGAPKEAGSEGRGEEISQAELDVLLPKAEAQVMEAPMEMPMAPAAMGGGLGAPMELHADEAEQQMVEAEGVLAEELSQLLAETQRAEPGQEEIVPMAGGGAGVVEAAGMEAVGAQAEIAFAPAVEAVVGPAEVAAAAPVEAAVSEAGGMIQDETHAAHVGPVGEAAVAAVTPPPPPPGVPEHPVVELADQGAEEETGRGGIVSGVALMFAQLVDMPFAWIGEVDKNMIGVIAFLLLLGGIVFRIMAWAISGQ